MNERIREGIGDVLKSINMFRIIVITLVESLKGELRVCFNVLNYNIK